MYGGGGGHYLLRSVEEVFREFKGRRAGIIKALTTDVFTFYQQCDPEKVNLCLYGYPNGTWEVREPPIKVPSEIPEPPLGINFARDVTGSATWLRMVAFYSDSWLISVAYYLAGRFHFDKPKRDRLFTRINDLPTIAEVLKGAPDKQDDEDEDEDEDIKLYKKLKKDQDMQSKEIEDMQLKEILNMEYTGPQCGICGKGGRSENEPWIFCPTCDEGYHRECVNPSNHVCKGRGRR